MATTMFTASRNSTHYMGMVAHAFNPNTGGNKGKLISELEPSLVYRVSSRTVKVTQRNPVFKNKTNKKKKFCSLKNDGLVHPRRL